jgi:cytochrome c biogenesis factor
MLGDLGRLALALGALFGGWGVVASLAARPGRGDLAKSAGRGVRAATASAVLAVLVLTLALYATDVRVAFVAAHSSLLMPPAGIPAALLSDAAGALPALAALTGLAGIGISRRVAEHPASRFWATAVTSGVVALALGVAAQLAPLDVRAVPPAEGRGLAPELQHAAVITQGLAWLAGTGLSFGAYLLTVSGLAAGVVGDRWSRAVRPWNAATFVLLLVGLAASASGAAAYPAREPWLADRGTIAWLTVCAVSAWLVQLDRGRQGADRVVMRLLLTVAVFVGATAALALTGAAFVRPLAGSSPRVASLLGFAPLAALAVAIHLLRQGKGALGEARTVTAEPRNRAALIVTLAGIVLLAGAAVGSMWTRSHSAALGDTEILRVRDPFGRAWSFRSQGVSTLKRDNFASFTITLLAERDSARVGLISAEARSYLLADETDAAPPIGVNGAHRSVTLDTRVGIVDAEGARPTLRVTFVPLASWLVPGTALLSLGVLLHAFSGRRSAS